MDNFDRFIDDELDGFYNDWLETKSVDDVINFLEKEIGLKISNCKYNDHFGYTGIINTESNIKFSLNNCMVLDNEIYYHYENDLDELAEQYDKLSENEFKNYMYKSFSEKIIYWSEVCNILYDEGPATSPELCLEVDETEWTSKIIDDFLNVINKFNNFNDSINCKIYINDDEFHEGTIKEINKLNLIKFLIQNNWLDIDKSFDRYITELIYRNVINEYVTDIIHEMTCNKELQGALSNDINNMIIKMIENGELEIK